MLHSLFLRVHCRFLSLPLLGSVADGFSDWLAANGYTRVSRQNSIRMLPNVDADLRRRQVEELSNLPNRFSAIVDGLSARTVLSQQKQCGQLERYPAANGLIADGQPATGTSPASKLAKEYVNYLPEVRGFTASTVSNHRHTVQCFLVREGGSKDETQCDCEGQSGSPPVVA